MLVSYQRDAVPYQRDSAQLVGKILIRAAFQQSAGSPKSSAK
jgi:hypothetical protein